MIAYGLDFGTTNSVVAKVEGQEAVSLPIEITHSPIVRSTLYFHPEKGNAIGQEAINKYLEDVATGEPLKLQRIKTGRIIMVAKFTPTGGFAGEKPVEEYADIEVGNRGRLLQGLKSVLAHKYFTETELFGKKYTVEELLTLVLNNLKEKADNHIGKNAEAVVLGRPVKYVGKDEATALSRMETVAKEIGFKHVEFEPEPLAAARAYNVQVNKPQNILVFDFGGGTLDISITQAPSGKILAVEGAPIGGDLLNSMIFIKKLLKYFGGAATYGDKHLPMPTYIEKALENWYSISLLKTKSFLDTIEKLQEMSSDRDALLRLRDLIIYNLGFYVYEKIDIAKKNISEVETSIISIHEKSLQIDEDLFRLEFEDIIDSKLKEIRLLVQQTLDSAMLNVEDIDVVVTTGGSSLIPAVQVLLKEKFGNEKVKSFDVFESVAKGLALKAKELYD
jgi:hypothetical chaperone protein